VCIFGPPVLGSSLILLFEENWASSPVAFVAELASGKMTALDKNIAIIPTMSKTIKIRVNRVQRFFAHLELAS
jgi:hypothetical protein